MRTRAWGSTDIELPVVGQGTWNMEDDDRAGAVRALRRGIDLGMTHIDTAELYGDGAVEAIVGEAIAGRRDEIFLVSKVLPVNASREGTIAACERSLRRLGTDHLDGYLLHWIGPHPLEETVSAFEALRESGKIASWGVSNFDETALERIVRIAGDGKIACNQVLHHLGERAIEHAVIPFCDAHGIAVVSYSPFGSGDFRASKALRAVAEAHGASERQIALAFLAAAGTLVIPKAAQVAHVEDNAGAGDLVLSPEEVAAIGEAHPRASWRGGVPTL